MSVTKFTQLTLVFAIVALIVGFSACDQIQQVLLPPQPEMPPEMEAHEIPIGVVVAQTGPFAPAYGLPMLDGFKLASEHINNSGMLGGAQLKLIDKDDQSVSAVDPVNELIALGVPAIVGFAISTQLEGVTQTAQDNGVVLFSSVSSAPVLAGRGDFTFRVGLTSAVLNPPLVRATHEKFGYQKAATIHHKGDTYSTLSDKAFRDALVESGVEVVITETYEGDAANYTEQLTRIMELNPEALFISALGAHIPGIMKEARQLMPSVHIIVPELTGIEVAEAGDDAEGVVTSIGWFSMNDSETNQAFIQSYTAKYGEAPVAWAAQSYATLRILAAAIVAAQSAEATAVREMLANIMDLDTVLGQFSFNDIGDGVYDPNILIVENGEFVVFE